VLIHTLIILALLIAQELLTQRTESRISLKAMIIAAKLPWAEQEAMVFCAG